MILFILFMRQISDSWDKNKILIVQQKCTKYSLLYRIVDSKMIRWKYLWLKKKHYNFNRDHFLVIIKLSLLECLQYILADCLYSQEATLIRTHSQFLIFASNFFFSHELPEKPHPVWQLTQLFL